MSLSSSETFKPYKEDAINLIYNMLFCDQDELYTSQTTSIENYPWSVLFNDPLDITGLQRIILDEQVESRVKLLAFAKLKSTGQEIEEKELLGVIVEVGMEEGLDLLASYRDGTARYINYTGSMIIWDTTDETSDHLTHKLFQDSLNIVRRIGPWDKERLPPPSQGKVRISFLVSDGLYFGEGQIDTFFNDPLAAPAVASATALMQFLVEKTGKR